MLLVNYQVSEEPRGLIYILVNYTFHTRCMSKSSAVLINHPLDISTTTKRRKTKYAYHYT